MLLKLMIMNNNKIGYWQSIHVNDVVNNFKIETPDNNAAYCLKIKEPSRKYPWYLIATTQPTTQNNLKQFLFGWY